MAKKCCPRIRIACKKMGAESVSQTYYTLKGPLNAPVKHTATAHIPARTKCAVMLGNRAVSKYVPLDSKRLDAAKEKYVNQLKRMGCSDTDVKWGAVTPDNSPKLPPKAPGIVRDRLQKLIESRRRK